MQTDDTPRTLFSRQELALLAVTMVWGATFLVVRMAMQTCGPLFFVGLRFTVAGTVGLLLSLPQMRRLSRREILAGAAVGLSIWLGYGLQSYGLRTISGSTSAFLTALYVPIVPLLQWGVLRRRPRRMTWVGIAFAFLGLLCFAGPNALHVGLGRGEVATLVGTVAIAAEILLIGRFTPEVDSRRFTVVQLLAAGLFSLLAMPLGEEPLPAFSWIWLLAALGLGLASAVIQLTMTWAQKAVSPARATLIYSGEPVWGGLFGRLAGERLPALSVFGGACIVAGILISELKPGPPKPSDPANSTL